MPLGLGACPGTPRRPYWDGDPKDHKKDRFATLVRESDKVNTSTCPERLDFDAPACTESLFSLLQICSISAKLCCQKPSKLSHMGAGRSKKMDVERFGKHVKNITTKVPTSGTNLV